MIIIDGGLGQLKIACNVYNNIKKNNIDKLDWNTTIIGVAKGENRNAGEETIILETGEKIHLPKDSSDLHFIQHLRNEAHRFAITYHRTLRDKRTFQTELTEVEGIGEKTAQKLLKHFGAVKNIKSANREEVEKVAGKKVAEKLYAFFAGQEK